jgi:phage terminase large subunit-like protein
MTHAQRAHQYALDVVEKRLPACKWVRLACQRHLEDLERAKTADWPYRYEAAKGERVCVFGEKLPHVKGKWARKDPKTRKASRIKLEPAQCFILCSLFGWVKKSNSMRRFKFASVYMPRKNAKSMLACIIGWWMFAKDDEPGAEVYSGATSEKQAWEVFGPARQMAIAEPALAEGLGVTVNARSLVRLGDNAKFEPIIGKPGDGASPHLAIVDEYHEHPDATLYDTMKTGMGAREQPIVLIISTAGDNLAGPCKADWDDCQKLLAGIIEEDTHFAIIWCADDGDDWTAEASLAKANPLWGISVNPEIIMPDIKAAMRDPHKQATVKTKHLNLWVTAAKGWLNLESWRRCGDSELSIDEFAGKPCWLGLDAASKVDMTSLTATFRTEKGYAVFAKNFMPEDTVSAPENRHYQAFAAKGWLVPTPGARVDFTVIEDQIREWDKQFQIQSLGYDPKELNDFINRVRIWCGFELIEITQAPALISEPMKEMEAQVASGTYQHQNDECLTWMFSNVVKKEARGGGPVKYYYPTKEKAQNKIDGAVSSIMGLRQAMLAPADSGGIGFAFAG